MITIDNKSLHRTPCQEASVYDHGFGSAANPKLRALCGKNGAAGGNFCGLYGAEIEFPVAKINRTTIGMLKFSPAAQESKFQQNCQDVA